LSLMIGPKIKKSTKNNSLSAVIKKGHIDLLLCFLCINSGVLLT
jgi:hypothetical protein